jgi:hypothetical protein
MRIRSIKTPNLNLLRAKIKAREQELQPLSKRDQQFLLPSLA